MTIGVLGRFPGLVSTRAISRTSAVSWQEPNTVCFMSRWLGRDQDRANQLRGGVQTSAEYQPTEQEIQAEMDRMRAK